MIRRRVLDHDTAVSLVEIDRHERRNALDVEHLEQLRCAVLAARDDGARSIVITGAGTSFCAGADLDGVYGQGERSDGRAFRDALYGTLHAITTLPLPVVAAVNGPAIGAGTQLAIACDLRVAGARARFAVPTARNGLAVDPWTVRRVAVLAGGGSARAMLLGADTLDAATAHARGLADRLGEIDDALTWAREIAGLAPLTLTYSKQALDALLEPEVDAATSAALDTAVTACWESDDYAEGRRAREEKRNPRFTGR